jgi:beta-lactamase class D
LTARKVSTNEVNIIMPWTKRAKLSVGKDVKRPKNGWENHGKTGIGTENDGETGENIGKMMGK